MKYPLLHPSSYLILGAMSVPLAIFMFYYHFFPYVLIYFLSGFLSGISVNETWFVHAEKNIGVYKKFLKAGKTWSLFRNSSRMLLAYAVTYVFSISVFFFDFSAFLAVIAGMSFTGLIYYGDAKKLYRRL